MAAYRRDRKLADILLHGKLKRDKPRQRSRCKADCKVCVIKVGKDSICILRGMLYTVSHALSAESGICGRNWTITEGEG